jgi:hypothetical protein
MMNLNVCMFLCYQQHGAEMNLVGLICNSSRPWNDGRCEGLDMVLSWECKSDEVFSSGSHAEASLSVSRGQDQAHSNSVTTSAIPKSHCHFLPLELAGAASAPAALSQAGSSVTGWRVTG